VWYLFVLGSNPECDRVFIVSAKEIPVKSANIICGLFMMAFSAYAFIVTFSFRQFTSVPIGPEFFPRLLAAGLFICSFALFLQGIMVNAKRYKKAPTISPFDKNMRRLFIGVVIILAYVLSWRPIGFLITTPLTIVGLMYLLGFRKYFLMILISLGATAVVYGSFSTFLNVLLPLGLMGFLF